MNEILDLNYIFGPKVVGKISETENNGSWNATDCTMDPYSDVISAIMGLPEEDYPDYLLMNKGTAFKLERMDSERVPFYIGILNLFGVRFKDRDVVKPYIFKVSNKVPNGIALLVSDNMNIVIINTE
jgi:hypothetical protein